MLQWGGIGLLGGLLACGDAYDPYATTASTPGYPTTYPQDEPTTYPPQNPTTAANDPTTGQVCSGTDEPCEQDADCCDDICLPSGLCGRFADGELCGKHEECESNFCSSKGVCGCLAAGLCCEDGPGDCCGACNANNTCEADTDCGESGTYCGIFFGASCCPGYYCDFSFFGSYCKKDSNPPPEPPDPCKEPETGSGTDTDDTTATTQVDTDTTGDPSTSSGSTGSSTTDPMPDLPPPDPVCGDGMLAGDEVCDGLALGAGQCTDFPGFAGGTLACAADCTYDTGGCCKATTQPCAADSECCPGTACKFDLLMLKNVCK